MTMSLTIARHLDQTAEVTGDIGLLPDISTKVRLWRQFVPYVSLRLPDRSTVQLGYLLDRPPMNWARRNLESCSWAQPGPLPATLLGKIRRRNHR